MDRLLLDAGVETIEVFQCVKVEDCFYTADDPIAVRGHMASHGKAMRRAAREAEEAKANRSATAASASAAGREAREARVAEIQKEGGPIEFLLILAAEQEEWAKYVRECARMLKREGLTAIDPERLAQLEEAEQRLNGIMAAAGITPRQSRRSR